jgi:cyanophycinase
MTVAKAQTQSGNGYTAYRVGSATDVVRTTSTGAALMGGGPDVDAAFTWMIGKSGGGNFVVLRSSGTDAYNPYIQSLGSVASVETLIVTSRAGANDAYVAEKVRNAEAVFIAGGDQATYWNNWKGTALSSALQSAIDRGIPVGGTSAGMAVLGEFVYTALNNSVTPTEALRNPYNSNITLGTGFLNVPNLDGIITDTHFYARDRMGRPITFLARLVKDGWIGTAYGIASDEGTAALIDGNGTATIVGSEYVYFFRTPGQPQTCVAGSRLTYRDVNVYRCAGSAGQTFNLNTWTGSGGLSYRVSAVSGSLSSSKGSIY